MTQHHDTRTATAETAERAATATPTGWAKILPIAFVAGIGLAGCNTIEGFGEDVEEGGETITEGADEVEDDI